MRYGNYEINSSESISMRLFNFSILDQRIAKNRFDRPVLVISSGNRGAVALNFGVFSPLHYIGTGCKMS